MDKKIPTTEISFTLNGRSITKEVAPSTLLIDLIRNDLQLKGTKPGCLEGECGACTVIIDNKAINSCLYLAVNIHGKCVMTIEGLAHDPNTLDPVQEALIKHGAVQCGFCTSGMAMTIKYFQNRCLKEQKKPTRDEIKMGISGNLCRCTGYVKIVDAVESLF